MFVCVCFSVPELFRTSFTVISLAMKWNGTKRNYGNEELNTKIFCLSQFVGHHSHQSQTNLTHVYLEIKAHFLSFFSFRLMEFRWLIISIQYNLVLNFEAGSWYIFNHLTNKREKNVRRIINKFKSILFCTTSWNPSQHFFCKSVNGV